MFQTEEASIKATVSEIWFLLEKEASVDFIVRLPFLCSAFKNGR